MQVNCYDLFGDVPVSTNDVRDWLKAVPHLDPDTERAALYVRQYRVVDKIKAAKLNGTFDAAITPPAKQSDQWWNRFRWS